MMEMAKVTSKGQITIPISIRRNLGINEGDKILFINKEDGVLMVNPDTFQGDITEEATAVVSKPKETKKPTKKKPPDSAAHKVVASTPAPIAAPTPAVEPVETVPAAMHTPEAQPEEITYAEDSAQESYAAIEYEAAAEDNNYASPPITPAAPLDEPEKQPDMHAGGINLSTLLDDIRSIGSNI